MLGYTRGWLVAAVATVAACSSSGGALFGSGNEGAASDDGSGGDPSGVSAGNTASSSVQASSTSGQGAGGQGGGTVTSSSSGESGAGAGPPQQQFLQCGNAQCPVGGDNACCHDSYQVEGQPQSECVSGPVDMDDCHTAETSDAGLETRIECQLPAHCPQGQVCCGQRAQLSGQTVYVHVTCESQCEWTDVTLCDPQAPVCPEIETQGGKVQTTCVDSGLLPDGYFVCGF